MKLHRPLLCASILAASAAAQTAPPNLVHMELRLSSAGGAPLEGPHDVEVRIYDAAVGGAPLWSELHPAATVLNGVAVLDLGSLAPFPAGLFEGGERWLALEVDADGEMAPRRQVLSVPYALLSARAASLDAGTVIAPGLIGPAAIAAGAIDGSKVLDGSLGSADLLMGSIGSAAIGDGAVGSSEIANASILGADLAPSAITANEIATGAVGAAEIADPLSGTGVGAPVLGVDATGVGGTAILGRATNAGIFGFGLRGESASSAGAGVLGLATALAGDSAGVYGESDSDTGVGVHGFADSDTGFCFGVYGESDSSIGRGMYGLADSTTGVNYGVYGLSKSGQGSGVHGLANASIGSGHGVSGTSRSQAGAGLFGLAESAVGQCFGLLAECESDGGYGAFVYASASTPFTTYGLWADSNSSTGRGVYGQAGQTTGVSYGVRGQSFSSSGFGVYSLGDFGGNGAKYFVQPHPSDASKEIRYVCLEGPESGTYFRGSGRLAGGVAAIEVPEHFRLVSEAEGLTVQLTPRGPSLLWCESVDLERVLVRGEPDAAFDYQVNGVRRGFAGHEPMRENQGWVPEVRGVPFGTQYPEAVRRILVENGTLASDFTPDERTAARLGWTLRDPGPADLARLAAKAAEEQP